jgi:cytochrome c-type biogenesis protein CcmF
VFHKPMIVWLWIGGALMALGTVLAAFPGERRRRPTDPVSAAIRAAAASAPPPEPTEERTEVPVG